MIYRVILSPDAKAAIRSAVRWYLQYDINVSFRFRAELETTLRRIARNPFEFALSVDRFRRARMKRFPYWVYFTLGAGTVYVVAVSHQRRLNPLSTP
jgi:plasmid stabilization system protein ParE